MYSYLLYIYIYIRIYIYTYISAMLQRTTGITYTITQYTYHVTSTPHGTPPFPYYVTAT